MESRINRGSRKEKKKRQRYRRPYFLKEPKPFHFKSGRQKCQANFFCKTRKVAASLLNNSTMNADAFWQNYNIAQEWQNKHSATWWKTKCFALEHENQILRNAMRKMALKNATSSQDPHCLHSASGHTSGDDSAKNAADENFEFCVDEGMMSFLTQSLQHKRELQISKEHSTSSTESFDELQSQAVELNKSKAENAKELYGEASSLIMAMETAVHATIERHKDIAKPQYWPNIPFKP